MPYGIVNLKVLKNKKQPKLDVIFKSFRDHRTLFIEAEQAKNNIHRWRPIGRNSFEIKIISIELLPDSQTKKIPSKGDYYFDYLLTGELIGMNGQIGVFPKYFSWPSDRINHEIKLLFNSCNRMELQYGEYLTL